MTAFTTLDAALAATSHALCRRAMDEMYAEDPFWAARFGDRGRRHADEDNDFHVKYLREALAAGSPAVFENYARWLREMLVARGMCSRHIADNFAKLAAAIADETTWPDAERARAIAVLRAGKAALAYTEGPAAALEVRRAEIVTRLAAALALPPVVIDTLVSFALDALAFAEPARLTAHLAFARPPAELVAALQREGVFPP